MKEFLIMVILFFSMNSFAFAEYDNIGRLINYPDKIETSCPTQDEKTGVVLVIGQSNSANHAEKRMKTRYPNQVFNYFEGKCYLASSPLLGATGEGGEFITPLADYLIDSGTYNKLIIVASGIKGTKIELWKNGGYLSNMLISILDDIEKNYKITEVIWHQGESDFLDKTSPNDYAESFKSLVSTIRQNNSKIPIFYAIATWCTGGWEFNNSIAEIQRSLANKEENIYLGANTDELVTLDDRYQWQCHFKESGQLKTAYAFSKSIYEYHQFF